MYKVLEKIPHDFPIVAKPYEAMAKDIGISGKDLIDTLKRLRAEGAVRRVAAVLYHRRAFYTHNAMVVWRVEDNDVDRVGGIISSFPQVSHCYERDRGGYWEYNLFSMIHGKRSQDCTDVVKAISERTGIKDFQIFFSKREFKKISFSVHHG
jgi:DNA-binding Lrp family transcriptional regulator